MDDELISEYGSSQPIRFANPKLCNSEGEEILCKCGKPVDTLIAGVNAYVARCNDCMEKP
ncbi:MAG: hypothetical protein ACYC0F_18540 [Rhodanobacter sp.]